MGSLGLFYSLIQARISNAIFENPIRVLAIFIAAHFVWLALFYLVSGYQVLVLGLILIHAAALPIIHPLYQLARDLMPLHTKNFEDTPTGKKIAHEKNIRTLKRIAEREEENL